MKSSPESRLMLTAAAVAIAVLAMSPARAQTTSPSSPPAASQAPAGQTSGAKMMTRDADANHPLSMARVSALKGVDIFDADRKKIAEINDVLIDPKSGTVHQVVVASGGMMGVGDKQHGAMMKDVKLYSRAADDLEPVKATVAQSPEALPAADKAGKDSGFVSAAKFIGTDVVDASGKTVGEIEDLVVDLSTGQSRYALVEFDKAWSPVDKLFAFEMKDLRAGAKDGKLQVNATKESLERMPSIDRKMLDRNELSQLTTAR